MGDESLCFWSLHGLAEGFRTRNLSPRGVGEAHLRQVESLNPTLFAFIEVTAESAREEARRT